MGLQALALRTKDIAEGTNENIKYKNYNLINFLVPMYLLLLINLIVYCPTGKISELTIISVPAFENCILGNIFPLIF